MAEIGQESLIKYEFSEEEYPLAVVFSDLQEKMLVTEITVAVQEQATHAVPIEDPNAVQRFVGEHEYTRGKIDALRNLLETSRMAKAELIEKLHRQIETQAEE